MVSRSSKGTTRREFLMAGAAGLLVGLLLNLLVVALTPLFAPVALLSPAHLGTPLGALIFLLLLGLLVAAELPLVLYALIRMARQRAPAVALNALHLAYVAFPAFYGMLGGLLTGERWWPWAMGFLSFLRLVSSALAIDPPQMAERHARGQALAPASLGRGGGTEQEKPSIRDESGQMTALGAIEGFVLDMDGVLYRGDELRRGAVAFVAYLNEHEIPYVCLTNNASRTSQMYQEKLDWLGIPVDSAQVLGAAQVTAEWLAGRTPPASRVLVLGEAGLRVELERVGFVLVEQPPAELVVAGIDFHITYERLKQAALAIRRGARFVGTNPDTTFPSEEGLLPGNGAVLAYLKAATGVEPTIIGKPSAPMMEIALAHLGVPRHKAAMVGDRLDTDILGGQRVGLMTILLRGGVTSDAELAATTIQPHLVCDDLGALLEAYRGARLTPVAEGS
ncbi:MAG: HAD-IIA family hydrolase, partial [Ardenticatenaceae bacterium]